MEDDSRMSKKQEMCGLGANSDFISNLPDNVTDQILVRLPIRDAVRTSVLSTNWRDKWTTITQLVFSDRLILPSPPPHNNNMDDKLIYFIDRVLLLHTGFIHKFKLSSKRLKCFSTIDCWIRFLLRKNIKEFILEFSDGGDEKYKLPSCFFSTQQLCTLELHCCALKPPPTFTGFSNLKSLYLDETTFVDNKDGFECLISKCPLLERLTWKNYDNFGHLNICSPNLKYLYLDGDTFEDIRFENTPLLSDVSIYTAYPSDEELIKFLQSETGNVVKVLSSLPSLETFSVGLNFVQFLTIGKIPEKLPFTCHHLNNLSLDLNFENVYEICVTLCLLNSSPNLRKLHIFCPNLRGLEIESNSFCKSAQDFENFWEERTLIHWNMSGLQTVEINFIHGFQLEFEFIKLLLANSPMLEMLSIRYGKRDILDREGLEFLKELLIFPRASPKARIKFFERNGK